MGPKLMDCCKPELVGKKEHGKMLKRIQNLEDGRVLAKEAQNSGRLKDKRKEYRRLSNEFEMRGFMAQKRSMESCQRENAAGQRCIAQGRR